MTLPDDGIRFESVISMINAVESRGFRAIDL
jgi:hypothetical protein